MEYELKLEDRPPRRNLYVSFPLAAASAEVMTVMQEETTHIKRQPSVQQPVAANIRLNQHTHCGDKNSIIAIDSNTSLSLWLLRSLVNFLIFTSMDLSPLRIPIEMVILSLSRCNGGN